MENQEIKERFSFDISQKGRVALAAKTTENCNAHGEELRGLFKAYEVAKLGYEMQVKMIGDIYEETLKRESFFADMDCERCGIRKGDRITEEDLMFLLSDEDIDRVYGLSLPLFVKNHITDENGDYITNWLTIKCNARRALVRFLVGKIIPEDLRGYFVPEEMSVVNQEKLIDIFRPMVRGGK